MRTTNFPGAYTPKMKNDFQPVIGIDFILTNKPSRIKEISLVYLTKQNN
jgi:hypothetical protein